MTPRPLSTIPAPELDTHLLRSTSVNKIFSL